MALLYCDCIGGANAYLAHHLPETSASLNGSYNFIDVDPFLGLFFEAFFFLGLFLVRL